MDEDPATTSIVCAARAFRVDSAKLRRLSDRIKTSLGVGDYELSIALVGSRRIRTLNREFRNKDKATDVLSFPQVEWNRPLAPGRKNSGRPFRALRSSALPRSPGRPDKPRKRGGAEGAEGSFARALGDVAISLPDAARNARRIGQPLDREVCFLLVHGILHLCGHDHIKSAEERRMLAAQRLLMAQLAGRGEPAWRACVRVRARRTGAA